MKIHWFLSLFLSTQTLETFPFSESMTFLIKKERNAKILLESTYQMIEKSFNFFIGILQILKWNIYVNFDFKKIQLYMELLGNEGKIESKEFMINVMSDAVAVCVQETYKFKAEVASWKSEVQGIKPWIEIIEEKKERNNFVDEDNKKKILYFREQSKALERKIRQEFGENLKTEKENWMKWRKSMRKF